MKYTVLLDEFEEREIRPPELYERYAELVAEELRALAARSGAWKASSCPACGSGAAVPAFAKYVFAYQECRRCRTTYVSPRPSAQALMEFRATSAAERFWRERVVAATATSRGRYVSAPRIEWILDNAQALEVTPRAYLHLGPVYDGIPEELAQRGLFDRVERIGEASGAALRGVRGPVTLASVFEFLQGQVDPADLLAGVRDKLVRGGRLLATTVSSDGFEIQMLREHARGAGLPSHINLFSIKGIGELMTRAGFRVIELSTPGRLDAGLVAEALKTNSTLSLPRFVESIIRHEEPAVLHHFQEFLQMARLSSHLRVSAEAV